MALRVPLRHPTRPPCRYSASCAQRISLRTAASAVRGACQVPVIRNRICSDLDPAKRGYFVRSDMKGNTHYRLAPLIVDRHLLHRLVSLSTSRRMSGCKQTWYWEMASRRSSRSPNTFSSSWWSPSRRSPCPPYDCCSCPSIALRLLEGTQH